MALLVFENFVAIEKIVEVRFVSDDPTYFRAPEDLYVLQNLGLREDLCKKDKKTTEQAFFYCTICECELKSIKTLRSHCTGTQHLRKQFEEKSKRKINAAKNENRLRRLSPPRNPSDEGDTLANVLSSCNAPIVGLRFVTELKNNANAPIYKCKICYQKDTRAYYASFCGYADAFIDHLVSAKHILAYLTEAYGQLHFPSDPEDLLREARREESQVGRRIASLARDDDGYEILRRGLERERPVGGRWRSRFLTAKRARTRSPSPLQSLKQEPENDQSELRRKVPQFALSRPSVDLSIVEIKPEESEDEAVDSNLGSIATSEARCVNPGDSAPQLANKQAED